MGIVWFFTAISIESSIVPIKDVMFEHRVYLPSFGWALAVVAAVSYGMERWGRGAGEDAALAAAVVFIGLTIVLAGAAVKRNGVWRDGVALWEDMVRKSPDMPAGTFALGYAYYQSKRYEEAIAQFKAVIRDVPEFAEAYNNLGNTYHAMDRYEEAAVEYAGAIKLKPDDSKIYLNLGLALADSGDIVGAVAACEAPRRRAGQRAGQRAPGVEIVQKEEKRSYGPGERGGYVHRGSCRPCLVGPGVGRRRRAGSYCSSSFSSLFKHARSSLPLRRRRPYSR